MLRTIILREILEYLKSTKFIIGLVLTVVLITMSTFINISDYQQRQQDYHDAQKEGEKAFRYDVFREPEVLSTLVQGKDRILGNKLTFSYMNIPMRTSGYMGYFSQHESFFSGFSSVDFAFVVRVVLSLLVIFLAYNSISEEKTGGTLKLTLSNRLPRDQLLLGKFLGGLFVILGSLTLASLIAVLILVFHPAVQVTGSVLLRIICMFGASVLYLVCFYTITLFVSVAVNRPAISLMILLQIWIFLIVIYPNLSVILSKQWVKLPSAEEIAEQKRAATQPDEEEFQRIRDAFNKMVYSGERNAQVTLQNIEINAKLTELRHQVDMAYSNRLTQQVRTAQTLSLLSPAVLYDMVMQRFSKTNIEEYDNFLKGVKEAWNTYIRFFKLRYTDIEAYRNETRPEFEYPSESMGRNFTATLPQWIILFLFSVLFFTLGYVNFIRKDVR